MCVCRCLKYEEGIRLAIQAFTAQHNRAPVVLDIGTGTGLLAMFAVRHGAAHVYACEMWDTMADIAIKSCETAFPGKITVLAKKSTDIVVGEGGDMPSKADLLVSEIFDSALRKPHEKWVSSCDRHLTRCGLLSQSVKL
jgi:protein arginine N-methyltransferase 7